MMKDMQIGTMDTNDRNDVKEDSAMSNNTQNNNQNGMELDAFRQMLRVAHGIKTDAEPVAPAVKPAKVGVGRSGFRLNKALENAHIAVSDEIRQELADFLSTEEVYRKTGKARIHFVPEGSPFLNTYHGEEEFHDDAHGIHAVLRQTRQGQLILNLCHPALNGQLGAEPQLSEEEQLKKTASIKAKTILTKSGITFDDEDVRQLADFLLMEEIAEVAFSGTRISIWPYGHKFLEHGLDSSERYFGGYDGAFAILRETQNSGRVLNIYIPEFSSRLRIKEYSGILSGALADWLILVKNLQVKGNLVNKDLSPEKEIESDRQYLENVMSKIKVSPFFGDIVDCITTHPLYPEVNTSAVATHRNEDGTTSHVLLFTTDWQEYAQRLAAASGSAEPCNDLLQGDLKKTEFAGNSYAVINPNKPALYLMKGKYGYRVNLYIPEKVMNEFWGA